MNSITNSFEVLIKLNLKALLNYGLKLDDIEKSIGESKKFIKSQAASLSDNNDVRINMYILTLDWLFRDLSIAMDKLTLELANKKGVSEEQYINEAITDIINSMNKGDKHE